MTKRGCLALLLLTYLLIIVASTVFVLTGLGIGHVPVGVAIAGLVGSLKLGDMVLKHRLARHPSFSGEEGTET